MCSLDKISHVELGLKYFQVCIIILNNIYNKNKYKYFYNKYKINNNKINLKINNIKIK